MTEDERDEFERITEDLAEFDQPRPRRPAALAVILALLALVSVWAGLIVTLIEWHWAPVTIGVGVAGAAIVAGATLAYVDSQRHL